jgi:DNA repair protein RecO (recombination protein O)
VNEAYIGIDTWGGCWFMKRVSLQPAYVLHRRSYRETSFLVDVFTPDYGRLTLIARGVRKAKSSSQGLLQPFIPLLISWSGRGELMLLTHVESNGNIKHLHGDCLFAGFYLNELVMALLQKWDAHSGLFAAYEKAVIAIQNDILEQKVLRSFEKYLLEEIGYGLLPKSEAGLQAMFVPEAFYRFVPDHGFVLNEAGSEGNYVFSGKSLLAIAREDWQGEDVLHDAKRLTRFILTPLMGSRQIYSRSLFLQPDRAKRVEYEE